LYFTKLNPIYPAVLLVVGAAATSAYIDRTTLTFALALLGVGWLAFGHPRRRYFTEPYLVVSTVLVLLGVALFFSVGRTSGFILWFAGVGWLAFRRVTHGHVVGPDGVFAAIVLFLAATSFVLTERTMAIGLIVIGVVWLAALMILRWYRLGDDRIDEWFEQEKNRLRGRALERLNLDGTPLAKEDPLVILAPILWEVPGVPDAETRLWRKGRDGFVRFNTYRAVVIYLAEHKISAYHCDINFGAAASLNEGDDEYYYRDIVAVSTEEASTNYTLPNGQVMRHAQSFAVVVPSGDRLTTIIYTTAIKDLTRGNIKDTGADTTIKALRKKLEEKKAEFGAGS
jgi:hypothetical protein